MNMNHNGSWIEIKCWIPFRSWYLYWDKEKHYSIDEFAKRKINVKYIKGKFVSSKYSFIGVCISCWSKDKTKVEEALSEVDKKLFIIDKDYNKFLNEWRAGIEETLIEEE